jgi:hypothetical protein
MISFYEGNLEIMSISHLNRRWEHRKPGEYKEYELSTYDFCALSSLCHLYGTF